MEIGEREKQALILRHDLNGKRLGVLSYEGIATEMGVSTAHANRLVLSAGGKLRIAAWVEGREC